MNAGKAETQEFEFDVAISFLSTDLATALEIQQRLAPELRCFVYSREQETVAGTDGLESFRRVFRDRARLSVVLYRNGWGSTPWTGIEEVAIRERCLQTKYRSLLIVNLDGSDTPSWVPDTYLHFDLRAYPVEQLVGAIKARAMELGTQLTKPSVADRAAEIERRRIFNAETSELLERGSTAWREAVEKLEDEIQKLTAVVGERTQWKMECGPGALVGGFVVVAQGQTVQIVAKEIYANTARNAFLQLHEYNTGLAVKKPGTSYFALEPVRIVRSIRIDIRRSPEFGWCWEMEGKTCSASDTAEHILGKLLDRISGQK